jgi:hypothetical protein
MSEQATGLGFTLELDKGQDKNQTLHLTRNKELAYGKHENNRGVSTELPAHEVKPSGAGRIHWTETKDCVSYQDYRVS